MMWHDVIDVELKGEYRVYLRFDDSKTGLVDVAKLVEFSGVFAPLREQAYFDQVRVDPDLGTIVWPNGADIDPIVLYAVATGQPIPDLTPAPEIPSD
jgi:hypothetical protein